MLLRLLLALLVASFTLPAAASAPACHADASMHHGAPSTPDKALLAHVCIGCAPLVDEDSAHIAPRIVTSGLVPSAEIIRLDLSGAAAPALPPPRFA